jgi:hypothetical protein
MSHVEEVVTLMALLGLRVYEIDCESADYNNVRIKRGLREAEPQLYFTSTGWRRGISGNMTSYRLVGCTPRAQRLIMTLPLALLDELKEYDL